MIRVLRSGHVTIGTGETFFVTIHHSSAKALIRSMSWLLSNFWRMQDTRSLKLFSMKCFTSGVPPIKEMARQQTSIHFMLSLLLLKDVKQSVATHSKYGLNSVLSAFIHFE